MVQHWICISNYPNADITLKKNVWGVSKRYRKAIGTVKIGDILLIFAKSNMNNNKGLPSAITGAFRVLSGVYTDNKQLFDAPKENEGERFPFRVKLELIEEFKKPVLFKPLVPKISFIKNKKMWSGSIRTAMRIISEGDYQLILEESKNM